MSVLAIDLSFNVLENIDSSFTNEVIDLIPGHSPPSPGENPDYISSNKKKDKNAVKKEKKVTNIDEYMESIYKKTEKQILHIKNPAKIKEDDISIPTIQNFQTITHFNYNVQQLKNFAKHYKLKIGGNKKELVNRIFFFLYLSSYVIKIQKVYRGEIQRKYNFLHGPAFFKRKICTNEMDFITMDTLTEIPYYNFFSYKDLDGFVYGFEISSLYNLMLKNGTEKKIMNPYNRNSISHAITNNVRSIIRLSNLLKLPIQLVVEEDVPIVQPQKAVELRALDLFQKIDELGNYSHCKWFLSLSRQQLVKFIRELNDIWCYRAQLPEQIKRNILPPNGTFLSQSFFHYIHNETNMTNLKNEILKMMEKMVNHGIDRDSQALGAYYILGALTLVNYDAAIALPWLYQSVSP